MTDDAHFRDQLGSRDEPFLSRSRSSAGKKGAGERLGYRCERKTELQKSFTSCQ
jgi:hypothetical protein